MFNLLIENGADVNMCNSKAWTRYIVPRDRDTWRSRKLYFVEELRPMLRMYVLCVHYLSLQQDTHLKKRHRYISKHRCIMLHSTDFTTSVLLLRAGAYIDSLGKDNRTPLHVACRDGGSSVWLVDS